MDKIIVYLDDADYALQQLAPMKGAQASGEHVAVRTHWILVACAPRMTRRISKWVSHRSRESWRANWAEKLYGKVAPLLEADGDTITLVLAQGQLPEQTRRLMTEHGVARVLDARRPKFGQDLAPVTEGQPTQTQSRWGVPGAVLGMGATLMLAAE